MTLTKKTVSRKLSDYNEIKSFMKRVFPKDELIPIWIVVLVSKLKKYDFSAFYDEDLFVGVLFTIDMKHTLFVFYLAVNDKIQSKGYGTILLSNLKDEYKDKPISLFMETLDRSASNYNQRVKRLVFYERNGFVNTGIKVGTNIPFLDILSNDKNFGAKECKKLLKFMPLKIFL